MSDKQPQQAMPGDDGEKGAPDGVSGAPGGKAPGGKGGAGESGGGGYPNPQTGKKPVGGFMGHGGQTDIAYHGTGQGGSDDDAEVGNVNAVTKGD